ncbi:MAG: transcriptional repressor NrdR [Nitrospinae bacterium]|nr:transcriptional repressor NrdR [Nitrospinota bacterium]
MRVTALALYGWRSGAQVGSEAFELILLWPGEGAVMHCPFCRHPDSRVVDSRETDEGQAIRRRRSCPECGRRFTTVETAVLAVVKRSGVTEPFSREKVIRAVREREKTGSTGIGNGIGVPHARHDSMAKLVGAFARSTQGIQFDALDGEPVYLVFMLLSSKALTGQHLDALKCISRFHREEKYCKFLRHAKNKAEVRDLFKEVDENLAGKGLLGFRNIQGNPLRKGFDEGI